MIEPDEFDKVPVPQSKFSRFVAVIFGFPFLMCWTLSGLFVFWVVQQVAPDFEGPIFFVFFITVCILIFGGWIRAFLVQKMSKEFRQKVLVTLALAPTYFVLLSVYFYESSYEYKLLVGAAATLSVIVFLTISLVLAVKGVFLVVLASIVGAFCLLAFFGPWPDMIINNYRITVTSENALPQDDDIVEWGGGGFFQTATYYYLLKTSRTDPSAIDEIILGGDKFHYLSRCQNRRRLSTEYVVIACHQ